jgi:hypothetical protein
MRLQRKEEMLSHEKLLSRDSWVLDGAGAARISRRFALADSTREKRASPLCFKADILLHYSFLISQVVIFL